MPRPNQSKRSSAVVFNLGVLALTLGTLFFMVSRSAADPDLWGHLTFGNEVLRTGHLTRTDHFSYLTQGQDWVDHEWLTEVVFAKAFNVAGSRGLILLKLFLTALIGTAGFFYFRKRALNSLRSALVVISMFVPMFVWFQTIRAQMFTYAFLFYVLISMNSFDSEGRRLLWGVPPVFALWANFHGGFLAGIAIFYLWAGITVVERSVRLRSTRWLWKLSDGTPLVFAIGLGLPATLVTPYGVDLWFLLLRTALLPRPEIVEWTGLKAQSLYGVCYLLMVITAIAAIYVERRRVSLARIATIGAAALAPLLAYRHLPIFALAWGALLPDTFASIFRRWPERVPTVQMRYIAGAFYFVGALYLFNQSTRNLDCIAFGSRTGLVFPVESVEFLKRNQTSGNMAVYFNWGEYVLYHLSPQIRVSIDGRRETAYSTAAYLENLRLTYGVGDWEALLRRPETQLALFPVGSTAYQKLTSEKGWRRWHEDGVGAIFAKDSIPEPRVLADEENTNHSASCFPGP